MPFIIGASASGGNASALAVKNTHIFANTTARNAYFVSNPSELVEDTYISVSGVLQKRVGATWVDTSAVIKGADGADAQTPIVNYSIDGLSGWTSALNPAIHKYWRWSTNNGIIWTPAVKFAAEEGAGTGVPDPYEYTIGANNILELRKGGEIISTVDEKGFWSIESLSTGNGDLYLGEGHYVGSSGENVVFKNESSDLFWHPCWGAINGEGTQIVEQSARVHFPVIQKVQPAGAAGAGSIEYNSTFTAVSNAAFLYLDIIPKETFIGVLKLVVTNAVTGAQLSSYDFSASLVDGVSMRVPFKRPIWANGGQQFTTAITKANGDYIQVLPNSAGTAPWREASFLTFTDYDVFHTGNSIRQASGLNALTGANRIAFGAIRDVPTMSNSVAGVAKLGSTMSINGNGELNTSISPTGIKIVADQIARLATPQTGGAILVIQQDDGKTYGIEAGQDTAVALNWKQIGTVATNVVSFNGRNGAVVPATGDYDMEKIGLTDQTNAKNYVFRVDNGVPYLEEIA